MCSTRKSSTRKLLGVSLLAALCAAATACSSSSSTAAAGTSSSAAAVASGPQAAAGVNLAAARAAIASVTGHPSPFPSLTPLTKRVPTGDKIMYLQCGTPVCAQEALYLAPAAKELGVSVTTVDEGSTATSAQSALAAALAAKPAGAILTAVSPQLFGGQLTKLTGAGIKSVSLAITNGAKYGIPENVSSDNSIFSNYGDLMANWVITQKQSSANVVFFGTPELSFTPPLQAGVAQAFAQNCPACKIAYQSLPIATIGTTAPSQVISYLHSHPQVNTVIFATMEAATGLAAALKDANLHVTTIGFAPSSSNLQDIKTGGLTAALGVDLNMAMWECVDVLARELDGQPITTAEATGGATEILTQKDITFNPADGWLGYPDIARRFAKIWG